MRSNDRSTAFLFVLPIIAAASCQSTHHNNLPFRQAKQLHRPSNLSQSQVSTLAGLTNVDHMNQVLDNICVPRVVGTPAHERVAQYIKSSLKDLGWSIESDEFNDRTPTFGSLRFENIIAKWNPNAKRFLTLACHYDSKYVKNYKFVGATDSAVPCMQMINLAKVMENQLKTVKNNDLSLMLLFLDGEEAFKTWGPTDSIYGARHLASKWHKTDYTFGSESGISDLDRIDLFVLLDLIGAPEPIFYNYFHDTYKWYSLLIKAENSLANLRKFENYKYNSLEKYFQDYTVTAGIEDDHLPFLKKNVPILHVIPYPFPDFWHTAGDNRNALSMPTIENLNKILRVFVASYLNMKVYREKDDNILSVSITR